MEPNSEVKRTHQSISIRLEQGILQSRLNGILHFLRSFGNVEMRSDSRLIGILCRRPRAVICWLWRSSVLWLGCMLCDFWAVITRNEAKTFAVGVSSPEKIFPKEQPVTTFSVVFPMHASPGPKFLCTIVTFINLQTHQMNWQLQSKIQLLTKPTFSFPPEIALFSYGHC